MNHEEEIGALKQRIASLAEQIKSLEMRAAGHERLFDSNVEIRRITDRTIDRLVEMAADHSERLKAIDTRLWPGIAPDQQAIKRIIGKTGNPPGKDLDRRD